MLVVVTLVICARQAAWWHKLSNAASPLCKLHRYSKTCYLNFAALHLHNGHVRSTFIMLSHWHWVQVGLAPMLEWWPSGPGPDGFHLAKKVQPLLSYWGIVCPGAVSPGIYAALSNADIIEGVADLSSRTEEGGCYVMHIEWIEIKSLGVFKNVNVSSVRWSPETSMHSQAWGSRPTRWRCTQRPPADPPSDMKRLLSLKAVWRQRPCKFQYKTPEP